ncbi:MAG: exosortase/archaeosortase family protein [Candidatus Aenigmarchaeota archaeon]|nr:exosortase/archaeosortase family protein [Candidatus Aenigmarchaeota archaeon]
MKIDKKRLASVLKFLVLLNILMIPFYFLIKFEIQVTLYTTFVAFLTHSMLRILGIENSLEGNLIFLSSEKGNWIVEISWDSSGWKSLYLISVLALATPSIKFKDKIKFLSWSLPLIFFINLARILTTLTSSYFFGAELFEFLHTFLWRIVLIAFIPCVWFLWFRKKYRYRGYGRRAKNSSVRKKNYKFRGKIAKPVKKT